MKVVVVLALALFSVCSADTSSQGAPEISPEEVKSPLWDFFTEATRVSVGLVKQFKSSELGQSVDATISQGAQSVSHYVATLRSQDFMIQLTQEAEQLRACLGERLSAASTTVQPIAEELMAKLQEQVEEWIPKTQGLQTQLSQKTQDIRQSLAPYKDRLKAKLDNRFIIHDMRASKASTHQLFLPTLLILHVIKALFQ